MTTTAGTAIETITLTATGGTFADEQSENNFSIGGALVTSATVTNATKQADENKVQLTVTGCTPTQQGTLTVNAEAAAFTESTEGGTATITVEPAPTPEVSASVSETLQAGKSGTITLTISESSNTFADSLDAKNFTVTNEGETLTPTVGTGGTTSTTLTVTPVKSGNITVKVAKEAFKYQPSEETITASGTITATAADAVTLSTTSELTAGVANGSIQLTASANFAASPSESLFTLSDSNLTVSSVSANDTTATLTLTGTPAAAGSVTVTVQPGAFKYQPASAATVNVTVKAAEVSVTASGALTAGVSGTITLTATGSTFASTLDKDSFTVDNGTVTAVGDGGTNQVTLTVTPATTGTLTVTIAKAAFTYQPEGENVTTGSVTVSAPTGTLEAALTGTLYAGTEVKNQTVTLTIKDGSQGLTFKNNLSDTTAFTLTNGLSVTNVSYTSGSSVTLTLSGTPTEAGQVTITADKDKAFTIAPDTAPTATITVTAAPTVELSAETASITAGIDKTIKVKISSGDTKFVDSPDPTSLFTISSNDITPLPTVTNVEVDGTSKTATLTLSAAPSKNGTLTVTVKKEAFDPVAGNEPTTNVTVDALTGTVSATLNNGPLTAGTEVTNQTITLSIASSKLTFKESDLATTDFQLGDGSADLTIQSVNRTDATHVTLTLSGIPAAKGEFTVTAKTSAFAVPPTDNKDRTTEGTISIGYPQITLSATAKGDIYEDEAISTANDTITLTAEGGIFNATSETTNFTVEGVTGVTLASVSAAGDTNTATLTLSGTPKGTGNLTITVQPDAFKYKPESALTNQDISVKTPTGSITVTLNGDLYKGTPVNGQKITVSIAEGSHGLVFKSSQDKSYFTLDPDCGLTISEATLADGKVTLTLSGEPTIAGQVTVTATNNAFEYTPKGEEKGTITVKEAPTITLAGTSIVAGITKEITIQLTSANNDVKFVNSADPTWFTLSGSGSGLSVEQVNVGSDFKTVTLTLSAAPTTAETLIVAVNTEAFNIRPESAPEANITVKALTGKVSASFSGTLTAGTSAAGQTITLSITDTNGLTFKTGVGTGGFTLGTESEGLTISDVTRDSDTSVTLTLSGIPAAKGEFDITANTSAFAVAPTDGQGRTTEEKISIGYPTISVTAAPKEPIYEGVDIAANPITVTARGGVFSAISEGTTNFSISGIEGLTLASVMADDGAATATLTLSGTPTTTGDLTITIQPAAFKYQPENDKTATVAVNKPTGTVTATLNGDPLYKGTPVNGQTVTLTIGASSHGLRFQDEAELDVSEFMLKGDAAAGLTIESVTRDSDTQVTLTLGGEPTTAGDFEVDAENTAFTYDPGMEEAAGTFTVNPAPDITVTADPDSVTAGLELGSVTITAQGGTFLSELNAGLFNITSSDGIADNMSVTGVSVVDDATVTLTVSGAPTKDGTLIVTVDRTAFVIRPESNPEAKIAVAKLTGSVSMAPAGGELTAGTAADGLTLELEASGTGLTFREDAAPGDFLLTGVGSEGLTVASVTWTDETHVSLTLSGIPATAGELGVTVTTAAFAVPPTDGEDVTAAPSVTVAYPTITLAPTPATANEGEALTTITLTATGGVFNAIDGGTDGFAISGVEGVTLVSVTAADGSDTATLTLSGVPSATGTLTVTVQPEAFKYQPEKAVSAAISVVDPTGTVNAALSNALYADTPVTDQTITITIADSHGLTFKDGLGPDSFLLTGAAAAGLSISGVTGSGSAVTLTLSGTPAAGSFTVTVLAEAFTFDPGMDIDAGTVTVNAAPEVSLSVEPETLTAGEPVGTVTLTAVGGAFAAQPDASLFALSGDAASGLSVSAVSVEGAVAVLTVAGAPEIAGTLTVTVDRAAFAPVAAASPTVDITVEAYGDGSLSTEVEVDPGAPGTQFGSSDAELADAVLTEEEQALLDAGAKVVITLQEDDISDSVSSTDKAAVEANADGFTVGAYLDVSLLKSINDHETPIHETNRPIRVVFSIPTDLRGVSGREFAVVRVHEGSGTVLQDLDGDPNTITVETDLFSTYAILYRDAPTEEPTDEPTEEPTDAPTEEPTDEPTDEPTEEPTEEPTDEPTEEPTEEPVEEPTEEPTDAPTEEPTPVSTEEPKPTEKPSATAAPTAPDTGDDEAPALWLALLALGAGALVLAAGLLRRRSAQR